jgi:hypothetical protein
MSIAVHYYVHSNTDFLSVKHKHWVKSLCKYRALSIIDIVIIMLVKKGFGKAVRIDLKYFNKTLAN